MYAWYQELLQQSANVGHTSFDRSCSALGKTFLDAVEDLVRRLLPYVDVRTYVCRDFEFKAYATKFETLCIRLEVLMAPMAI